MNYKQTLATVAAIAAASVASAHQGVPGHVHAELSLADQALHAALNWAPVVGLALIAAYGLRRALRSNA